MVADTLEPQTFWQKILLKIFPKTVHKVVNNQKNIHDFYENELQSWYNFPKYLLKQEIQDILNKIKSQKRRLKFRNFFILSFLKSEFNILKDGKQFFQSYPKNYIKYQSQLNKDFFSGKETGDTHGLNQEQIKAILINEKENLLVAGPGSGKTRVIMDRVGFYHLKRNIPENRILILAFNKSAAGEVKARILEKYGLSRVEIRTFHSLGMKILQLYHKSQSGQINVESNSAKVIRHLIAQNLLQSSPFYYHYFSFFAHFLKGQDFGKYHDKNKKQLKQKKQEKYYTIEGQLVKSLAECEIANFFLMHDIKFEYESLVTWCDHDDNKGREYHPDFYLPEYDIYLEHWVFQPGNQPPEWFEDDENLYEKNRRWKCGQFKKYGKILWHTYYEQWKAGTLKDVLRQLCQQAQITLQFLDREDLMAKMDIGTQNHHLLTDMIISYIQTAKNCGFSVEKFTKKVYKSKKDCSSYDLSFFHLVIPIFEKYQIYLQSRSKIDFNDMINQSVAILEGNRFPTKLLHSELFYDMIFVDEFQDISPQRFQLLQQLMSINPDTRLFCVGDDWQAIYGFTGATNRYLTDCNRFFKQPSLNFLVKNYRNTDTILKYGSVIIQQTSDYIDKEFEPLHTGTYGDVDIHSISSSSEIWFQTDQYEEIYAILLDLIGNQGVDPTEIMILSRYTFGYTQLQVMCEEKGEIPIALIKTGKVVKTGVRFYTLHKSKGLEADVVMILNIYEGEYGFPSTMDSKVNYRFLNPDLVEKSDEEARLCFVGLTRARKQVFLFTWKFHESSFILPVESPQEEEEESGGILKEKFIASLIRETAKAYLFYLVDIPGKPSLWFPKSAVIDLQPIGLTKLRKIQVKSWILESKNEELIKNSIAEHEEYRKRV